MLAGDGLIVGAYDVLARAGVGDPARLVRLLAVIGRAVGSATGVVAGQGWESEPTVDLRLYHRAKTAALFEAATTAGAILGGGDEDAWRELGTRIGEAYQVADDLRDAHGSADRMGKPVGRGALLGRPSAASELGSERALARLYALRSSLEAAVPRVTNRERFVEFLGGLVGDVLEMAHAPSEVSLPVPATAASARI